MSLINDALKKAQRLRAEPPPSGDPLAGGAAPRVEKRSQPMRAQTMILLATAATVLVVFSVVATVYWLNRPSPSPARPPAAAKAAVEPAATKPAAPIVVSLPPPPPAAPAKIATDAPPEVGSTPATSADPTSAAAPPAAGTPEKPAAPLSAPMREPPPVAAVVATEAPVPREIIPAAPPPKPAHPVADPRIQQFVDSIRVTGIRSSGSGSKVLMNDRVYRIDDVVDRGLGVKLVKVESDRLTFVDANGIAYSKSF